MNVQKRVQTNKINYEQIKEINDKYEITVYKNETKLIDYCSPLNINNKDLTIYDRQLLVLQNKEPCDDGCSFQNFNYSTNYSTCLCKIINEDDNIDLLNELNKKIHNNELVERTIELIEKGNWKYFTCFKQAFKTNKNEAHNWIFQNQKLLYPLFLILKGNDTARSDKAQPRMQRRRF